MKILKRVTISVLLVIALFVMSMAIDKNMALAQINDNESYELTKPLWEEMKSSISKKSPAEQQEAWEEFSEWIFSLPHVKEIYLESLEEEKDPEFKQTARKLRMNEKFNIEFPVDGSKRGIHTYYIVYTRTPEGLLKSLVVAVWDDHVECGGIEYVNPNPYK